jgi:pyrimidine operon attenuation protein / uracil phosphoribosyltransferase
MPNKHSLILNEDDIKKKIHRIAYEILENNDEEKILIVAGVNGNGYALAEKLSKFISKISKISCKLAEIKIDKENPKMDKVKISLGEKEFKNKSVILVDDVANTGRTLLYSMKPILEFSPKKIQVAVLVDRKHKLFPVSADYVGLTLSTMLHEHVSVTFSKEKEAVYLS